VAGEWVPRGNQVNWRAPFCFPLASSTARHEKLDEW